MANLITEIESPAPTVFRRAYIRRRLSSTGLYETSWQEITPYIKKWSTLESSIDDTRVNLFRQADLSLVVRNDTGAFNPETSLNSLWSGYLTRYRTLVKVEAGYMAEDGTELPTNTCLGVWTLDGEIVINSQTNEAVLKGIGLSNVFDATRASEVTGIGATLTASDILAKIRDHTDGSGSLIFRQFISAASWSIQSTTAYYDIHSTTSIEGMSVWELMNNLAAAEGFVLIATRTGGLEFRDREPRTTTSQISLCGEGYARPNVIQIVSRKEAINKHFAIVRLKHVDLDTTSAWVRAGTSTTVDPASLAWKYGNQELEIINTFINDTATAQTLANRLYNVFSDLGQEYEVACKFLPQVEIGDRVDMNWTSLNLLDSTSTYWDSDDWASDAAVDFSDGLTWSSEPGENFDLVNVPMIVLKRRTDLEKFTTTLVLKEV